MSSPALSIVIPVLNETYGIETTLHELAALRQRGVEVVVVGGGSTDDTHRLAQQHASAVLTAPRGRARQMNAGATQARGAVLLFLHADTQLPPDAGRLVLESIESGAVWGRFDVRITGTAWMLRVVAAFMNVRSRWSGIATGDQALFVRRDVFERLGGVQDQPLMEDIELSKRLRQAYRPACLRAKVATSGRRWENRGVWRTIFLMWCLRWRYWRGETPERLAEAYR